VSLLLITAATGYVRIRRSAHGSVSWSVLGCSPCQRHRKCRLGTAIAVPNRFDL
jgi:hypothetical protein